MCKPPITQGGEKDAHTAGSIINSSFSRMLFHLREISRAREPTASSIFTQSSITFKNILQHLGSDITAEEACEVGIEVHDDVRVPA